MKVIFLLFFIFVGAQCTLYETDIYKIEAKNKSVLLADTSSGYAANDASNIYTISALEPLFMDPFEVEYDFQDEAGNSLSKGKLTSCNSDPSTPSGAAMAILLKSVGGKDASCPLTPGDYKVPQESEIDNVELGPDAMDIDTILLCLNMQQVFLIETYLYKVK